MMWRQFNGNHMKEVSTVSRDAPPGAMIAETLHRFSTSALSFLCSPKRLTPRHGPRFHRLNPGTGLPSCRNSTSCTTVGGRARSEWTKTSFACCLGLLLLWALLMSVPVCAADFGLAENVLREYGAIRYENTYTKVPTSGKLIAIRITANGTTYYICKEKNGYVIYHLEIRPMQKFKEIVEEELKRKSRDWNTLQPDELLLTKERFEKELKQKLNKYREAVWVRNEIVVSPPRKDAEEPK